MRKLTLFLLVAIVSVAIGFGASAKTFITGYDVNNGYAPVQVEKGVYVPGISLYPSEMIGRSTTQGNYKINGTLTVTGASTLTGEIQAQRVIQGGSVTNATSSLTGPLTLTAAQVCNSAVITVNTAPTGSDAAASIDITLPATSTLFADCLDTNGDKASFLLVNASPTAASTTEIIAGTGCNAMISGDTGAADTIAGSAGALITMYRATDYLGSNGTPDCFVTIEEMVSH